MGWWLQPRGEREQLVASLRLSAAPSKLVLPDPCALQFKKVFPEVEPRTQGEWVQEVRALLAR